MPITVVGSVAFDTVETPSGRRERCLAGAATYFSLAASFFSPVRVIAVVGQDFTATEEAVFNAHKIDTRGIERAAGKTFFWQGSYLENLNEAKTLQTDLNVFAGFEIWSGGTGVQLKKFCAKVRSPRGGMISRPLRRR